MNKEGSTEHGELRLLVVVVLYKMSPSQSPAFATLRRSLSRISGRPADVAILLYDNSPQASPPPSLPEGVLYAAAKRNEGLAGAYNYALRLAYADRRRWLLTLDQDTALPEDFLFRMSELAISFQSQDQIAAIVPQLACEDRCLSPSVIGFWGSRALPKGFVGIAQKETHAFNSGSMFRVSALREIGGFSREFWLDFLDSWVYRMLYRRGKLIYVAGNIEVGHELSLLHDRQAIAGARFDNLLRAESAFCDLYGSAIGRILLTARLFVRIFRQRMRNDPLEIRRATRECLRRRLFETRTHRTQEWKRDMVSRIGPSTEPADYQGGEL